MCEHPHGIEFDQWMTKADGDREVASMEAVNHSRPNVACYLVQQSMEKCLKAQMIDLGIEFPKTHSIGKLLDLLCPMIGADDYKKVAAAAARLTSLEATTRYSGEEFTYSDYQRATNSFDAISKYLNNHGLDLPMWSDPITYVEITGQDS